MKDLAGKNMNKNLKAKTPEEVGQENHKHILFLKEFKLLCDKYNLQLETYQDGMILTEKNLKDELYVALLKENELYSWVEFSELEWYFADRDCLKIN